LITRESTSRRRIVSSSEISPPPEGIEVSRRGPLDPLPADAVLVTGIDDLISDLDYALSAASALSARPRVQ
jgi:hypothetical protein